MHRYDELRIKFKSVPNSNLRFAIKEGIYPIYENSNHEFFEEYNNLFKINKENMLNIQSDLKESYENFLQNKEITFKIENVFISYKTWGQSQTLKADVLKYFYNNEKFNDEFWHIFFENIDDEISKDFIMKKYY